MDGRFKRTLAGGALAALVGCTTTTPKVVPPEAPPPAIGKNTVYIPEPADETAKKDGPISAATKVLFANMCVDMVAKDPNKPAADRERNLSQARQIYNEVLAAEPKNVDALMGLGEMYQVTGEQDRLSEVLNRAIKTHPTDAKVWAWVAIKQGQAKNWNAAAESYTRASNLDPDNRLYRMHLGFTLARAGRYDEGYACLAKSMRPAEAHYNLAMMMLHNGEQDRAKMELEKSLQADPNFTAAAEKLSSLAAGTPLAPGSVLQPVGYEELPPVILK
jgi:Tfp pilus assembly protein PilF